MVEAVDLIRRDLGICFCERRFRIIARQNCVSIKQGVHREIPQSFVSQSGNAVRTGHGVLGSFDGTTAEAVASRHNGLTQLVGDKMADAAAPVLIEQDCSMYVTELAPNKNVEFEIKPGRQAYLLCVEGAVTTSGGEPLQPSPQLLQHDAAEIRGEGTLRLTTGDDPAHVLLLEMAAGKGGRGSGQWPLHLG